MLGRLQAHRLCAWLTALPSAAQSKPVRMLLLFFVSSYSGNWTRVTICQTDTAGPAASLADRQQVHLWFSDEQPYSCVKHIRTSRNAGQNDEQDDASLVEHFNK